MVMDWTGWPRTDRTDIVRFSNLPGSPQISRPTDHETGEVVVENVPAGQILLTAVAMKSGAEVVDTTCQIVLTVPPDGTVETTFAFLNATAGNTVQAVELQSPTTTLRRYTQGSVTLVTRDERGRVLFVPGRRASWSLDVRDIIDIADRLKTGDREGFIQSYSLGTVTLQATDIPTGLSSSLAITVVP